MRLLIHPSGRKFASSSCWYLCVSVHHFSIYYSVYKVNPLIFSRTFHLDVSGPYGTRSSEADEPSQDNETTFVPHRNQSEYHPGTFPKYSRPQRKSSLSMLQIQTRPKTKQLGAITSQETLPTNWSRTLITIMVSTESCTFSFSNSTKNSTKVLSHIQRWIFQHADRGTIT